MNGTLITIDDIIHSYNNFFLKWPSINQLEAKEAAWRAEWSARLAEERAELERQLAEEKAAHEEAARAAAATLADERRMWQQQIDVLSEKARYLLSEKERLDRNIRQEVDTQVQVWWYNILYFFAFKKAVYLLNVYTTCCTFFF